MGTALDKANAQISTSDNGKLIEHNGSQEISS